MASNYQKVNLIGKGIQNIESLYESMYNCEEITEVIIFLYLYKARSIK